MNETSMKDLAIVLHRTPFLTQPELEPQPQDYKIKVLTTKLLQHLKKKPLNNDKTCFFFQFLLVAAVTSLHW